jgi:pyruvate-ferredoxin/flavodoxin oxidoreductase
MCPHAAIRIKIYDPKYLSGAPDTFKSADTRDGKKFTLQIAPEDCTGCTVCMENCPAKSRTEPVKFALAMTPQSPLREQEAENFAFFLNLPSDRGNLPITNIKGLQLAPHYFEFSGACSGCGETPYVRILTQMFGDRLVIANATGCSSIYGGNLPTTPYCTDSSGRGPAWSNSLFEDNAEYALGMKLAIDKQREFALELLENLASELPEAADLLTIIESAEIETLRKKISEVKELASKSKDDTVKNFIAVADNLVKKTVWALGGDGWAYDIGYGGLDHVLAAGLDINILVLDTEVYSNTGGQASKSTPMAANAKFASLGKHLEKKDLGMIAMTYGRVYVAHVSLSNPAQCLKAFSEAESYNGASIIIAYSHCIAHGIDMAKGIEEQRKAVQSGYWPLYRFDPRLLADGKNPLQLDSKRITGNLADFMAGENRFRITKKAFPSRYDELLTTADKEMKRRYSILSQLAEKLEY